MFSWIGARLREHFGFSKTEISGTFVLLLLSGICLLVLQGLKWYHGTQLQPSHDQDIALLEHTLALLKSQAQRPRHIREKQKKSARRSQAKQFFDINTASEAQLSTIKGIGPVLSARIVKFRNQLGGFINQTQYQEVYGLHEEAAKYLKQHTYIRVGFQVAKIDINTASVQEMAAHPYLTHQQGRSIAHYRTQHGPFPTVDALGNLVLLDEATMRRLRPYLSASQ